MANNRELSQFANVVGYNGGNIGIGTDNPQQKLHLSDTTSANIYLQTHNSGTGSTAGVYFRTSDSSTADGFFKTAIVLEDDGTSWARGKLHILQDNTTDNSNATLDDSVLTIDQSARLLVGHDSNTTPYVAGKVQVSATDSSAALSIARYQNTASNPYLALVKSRGGLGNATIVQDNDGLGYITFVGADGNDLTSEGAAIAAEVDGTPGQDDMPGALIFKTTSDGSNSASERLRIDSSGRLLVSTTSSTSNIAGYGNGGIQLNSTTTAQANVNIIHRNNSANTHAIVLAKARDGGANGGRVQNNDDFGAVSFQGFDGTGGTTYRQGAEIRGAVDGTPGNTNMPGRLEFLTTPSGSATPAERLRITSTGGVHFSNAELIERVSIVANKLSAVPNVSLDNGMVHYYTTNETTTATPNIISTASINTNMATGDTMSVTIMSKPNNAGYFPKVSIDGVATGITTYWSGGSAPSSAQSSGVDVNVYQIIKTADATFDVLANTSNFA